MEKNNIINKPIYKYKPISYYSSKDIEDNTEEKEDVEEEFNYVMDEQKLNKLKALKEERDKNIKNIVKLKQNLEKKEEHSKEENIFNKKDNNSQLIELGNQKNNVEQTLKNNKKEVKSKSVHSLKNLNSFDFESNKNNKKEIEKKSKTKKLKKKVKKMIIKKKKINNINSIDNIENNNKDNREKKDNTEEKEIDFKNKIKYIIKIQSKWLAYKSKRKLRYILLIKKIVNVIKKVSDNHLKYFFVILKDKKNANSNSVNININKLNDLLKKEKDYNILLTKYEEALKELNEIKNKIIFRQNLNLVNNKNENISINIFPKEDNNRRNNLVIDKTNSLKILKTTRNKSIFGIFNFFHCLKYLFKYKMKYYFMKFMFYTNNKKIRNKNKDNNKGYHFIINKIKTFSIINHNYAKRFINKNMMKSSQISDFIISKQNKISIFNKLDIQKQCLIKIENIKKKKIFISVKKEILLKREKKNIKNNHINFFINKVKRFNIIANESFIEQNIINYLKRNKKILETIKSIFNLKNNYFKEKDLCINKIFEKQFKKLQNKKNYIISKSRANNFFLNKVLKKFQNNYIITKIQDKFAIINNKIKSNNFVIVKNIKNFIIKGVEYSEDTIEIILFISNTYELTILSPKNDKNTNNFQINKIINNFIIEGKKEKNIINKYSFEENKLIINKIINNMKIINKTKEEFIINKLYDISIIINEKKKDNIITTSKNDFYIKGINKNKDLIINKTFSNYYIKNLSNKNNYIINKIININIENLKITNEEESFSKKKRRKKLKKSKKIKRFKSKSLFISDNNQLFINKSKINYNKHTNDFVSANK